MGGIVVVAATLVVTLCLLSVRIGRLLRQNIHFRLAFVFLGVFLVGSAGMWLCEHGQPDNIHFSTIPEAVWSATVHVLSGLEDREPLTLPGRLLAVVVLTASIGLFGTVAGKFASLFMRTSEMRMPKNISKHIAICNWNDRGDRIVRELHSPLAEPSTDIVVVTDRDVDEQALRRHEAYERVYFFKGDPALHDTLRTSRTHLAKSVIVLADDRAPDADARSTLVSLALRSLCDEDEKPHIVAESLNHRKMEHLRDAGVDEVICASDYGLGVLAQCALHAKLSSVYENLLTYSGETNEIYIVDRSLLSRDLIGLTFEQAAVHISQTRDKSNPAILLGIRRGQRIILNPRRDGKRPEDREFRAIEEGDALVVMAFHRPDLSAI